MLRVYNYSAEELGLKELPQGPLRLEGTEAVEDPNSADVFVIPAPAHVLEPPGSLAMVPFLKGNESRHVLFQCADHDQTYKLPILFIRCNLKAKHVADDPNSIAWPWPVEDLGSIADVPSDGFKYDITFRGWKSPRQTRTESVGSFRKHLDIKTDFMVYKEFFGYYEKERRGPQRRQEFLTSLHESKIVLAPSSIHGVFPYRFWEGLSAARVTVLVASDYNLPWPNKVDWDRCIIQISESDAPKTAEVVKDFLATHTTEQIIEMGKYGRDIFLKWMTRDKWPTLMTQAVEEALSTQGFSLAH